MPDTKYRALAKQKICHTLLTIAQDYQNLDMCTCPIQDNSLNSHKIHFKKKKKFKRPILLFNVDNVILFKQTDIVICPSMTVDQKLVTLLPDASKCYI